MIKKIISGLLMIALIATGITIQGKTQANVYAEEAWEQDAITSPSEGSLVGAGYIDVVFQTNVSGAKTYQVYFDEQPVYEKDGKIVRTELGENTHGAIIKVLDASECRDVTKFEVYTTKVAKHSVYIEVTLEDGSKKVTETRNFFVSKKGLALGGDMSDKISLNKLNASWYYNWSTDAFNNSIDTDVKHIPMMWGGSDENKEAVKNMVSDANYILGFNEPDIGSQANMNSIMGIRVWNECILPLGKRTVSPAPANPNGASAWVTEFLNGVTAFKTEDGTEMKYLPGDPGEPYFVEGTDCDAIGLHYYRGTTDVEGLMKSIESVWNAYHKPIWVTEVSVMGRKNTSYDYSYDAPGALEKVAKFVDGAVKSLDALPYVERYAWFPYDVESHNEIDDIDGAGATAMFEYASGLYTELGILYSNIGNPEGYDATKISDDEKFVWENRIIPDVETTEKQTTGGGTQQQQTTKQIETNNTTTKQQSTEPNVTKKLGKVSIKKIKNIKKKSISLTWKKVSGAKKYKIQYSTNKKFKKSVKTKYTGKLSYKIKGLKKGKKYYVRIRAVNGTNSGAWSSIKKVIIKR